MKLGIVVRPQSGEPAMVHYVTCPCYRRAIHRHLPVPPRCKVRLCRVCRPDPEDIAADPPEVHWFEYGPGVIRREVIPLEFAEKLAARRELGIGRRDTTGRRWGA